MSVSRISKVDLKTITTDLELIEESVSTEEQKEISFEETRYKLPGRITPKRFYMVGGEIFIYSATYKVAKYFPESNFFDDACDTSFYTEPKIACVKNNFEETFLIFSDDKALFLNQPLEIFSLGKVSAFCVSFGKVFTANGRELFVSYGFNINEGSHNFNKEFCFKTEPDEGDIIEIIAREDCVLLICQRKIISVSYTKKLGELVIERISTPLFNAEKNSVCDFGEKIVFLSNDKIAIYKNKSIEFVDVFEGVKFDSKVAPCSQADVSLFLIPYKEGSNKKILIFDVEEKNFHQLDFNMVGLSKYGGFFENSDKKIWFIKRKTLLSNVINKGSMTFNFNDLCKKILLNIIVKVSGSALLNISGDFGSKEYQLVDGINNINCNLTSREFNMELKEKSSDFTCEKMQLTYCKVGG